MKKLLKYAAAVLLSASVVLGCVGCDDALPEDLTEYDYKTPKPVADATPDTNTTEAGKIDSYRGEFVEKKSNGMFAYSIYSNGIQIDGFSDETGAETSEIPSEIDGVAVIGIASGAFSDNSEIKSLTVPSSVKYIGASTFRRCRNLETVLLSDGLEFAGDRTFDSCTSLTNLVFPETVKYIGKYVCALSGVENISIPPSIKEVPAGMYYGTCIKTFSVPEYVTRINESAFAKCDGLTEVTVPGTATYIGSTAFANNINLKKVVIEEGCFELGYGVFEGNTVLEEVHFPKSVEQFSGSLVPDANPDVILYVKEGSKTEEFAINKKYEYKVEK